MHSRRSHHSCHRVPLAKVTKRSAVEFSLLTAAVPTDGVGTAPTKTTPSELGCTLMLGGRGLVLAAPGE